MPCNLYGPGDNFDLQNAHVVSALIRKMHEAVVNDAKSVEVWGTGKPRREFLYVEDLADALVFLLKNYSDAKPINIGAGEDLTITELAEMIADVVGFNGGIIYDPSKPDGVMQKLMDSSRIQQAGWSPQTGLRDGVFRIYQRYKEETGRKAVA